jgi:hypothetical protein
MRLNDDQLYAKIRTLFLTNHLSQGAPAFGVATQVVRRGLGSLSWKQRFIYLGQVAPLLRTMDASFLSLTASLPSSEVCRCCEHSAEPKSGLGSPSSQRSP